MNNLYFLLICVILAILFGKMINVDKPQTPRLLFQARGYVERGNFSYFYIFYQGPIILNLTSISGDADLYVSERTMYPTYYPENYYIHSATCGEDIIELPDDLEGPTAIGVYGHAESSDFLLEGYENLNVVDYPYYQKGNIQTEIEFKAHSDEILRKIQTTDNNKQSSNTQPLKKKKKSKSSSNIPGIFSVLEILQLIFL